MDRRGQIQTIYDIRGADQNLETLGDKIKITRNFKGLICILFNVLNNTIVVFLLFKSASLVGIHIFYSVNILHYSLIYLLFLPLIDWK